MIKVGDKFILVSEEFPDDYAHNEVLIQKHKTKNNPADEIIDSLVDDFEYTYNELENDEVYILTVEKVLKKQSRWAEKEQ